VHDRIRAAIPGKEPLGQRQRKGRPIEDETGTGQPHVRWSSDGSPDRSGENSDDGSDDDRRPSRRSTRSARTRSHDELRRRSRGRDWEPDFPPPRARSARGPPPAYEYGTGYGPPARTGTWAGPVYARGLPAPAPYYSAGPGDRDAVARVRSRSMTAVEGGRRRRRRSSSRAFDDAPRSKKEVIQDSIKPLAAGSAGMVAGAFIGHVAGKGDMSAMIAGAVLGAIGGTEAEEYWEKKKNKERRKDRY